MAEEHSSNGMSRAEEMILAAHEDRLQHVERGVATCNQNITAAQVRLEHLAQQVQDGNAAIIDQMSRGFEQISAHLGAQDATIGSMSQRLDAQAAELAALKSTKAQGEKRLKRAKAAAIAAIVAFVGAAAKLGGESFYLWVRLKLGV